MSTMEKYLDAIEAAVETNDGKAMELLEKFTAYVYHELHSRADAASGDEKADLNAKLQRVQLLISRMAQAAPSIWL